MPNLNYFKNARLKVTKGSLLKDTIGVVVENYNVEFDEPVNGYSIPPFLFSLYKNADLVFGVFEDEIEILD
jgi:hypothetical protein